MCILLWFQSFSEYSLSTYTIIICDDNSGCVTTSQKSRNHSSWLCSGVRYACKGSKRLCSLHNAIIKSINGNGDVYKEKDGITSVVNLRPYLTEDHHPGYVPWTVLCLHWSKALEEVTLATKEGIRKVRIVWEKDNSAQCWLPKHILLDPGGLKHH